MEKIEQVFKENHLHPRAIKWLEKAIADSFFPQKAEINFERFLERAMEADRAPLKKLNKRNIPWICALFSGSQALSDMAIKNPEWLLWALQAGTLHSMRFKRDMRREMKAAFKTFGDNPKKALCNFKNRELLRIGWRDLLKWADTVETLEDLSRLADVCIEGALNLAEKKMTARFGRPLLKNGRLAKFIVLGMGKLGGRELNFSSDIDLIYVCDSHEGETEGGIGADNMERPKISISEYFSRLALTLTSLLNDIGPHGNVYRVDLGLRPEGSRGSLVCTLASVELYYWSWSQPWEKQAMIKARVCAGDESLGDKFFAIIRPFVYRKNLDFSALVDIQHIKEKIDHELKTGKNKYKNNVKLGKGGIREIEFIIQAYQLIYGGKMPWLAEANSLKALHRIFERGLLLYPQYAALADALLFLRDLENRMQITYGRQTQILPEGLELSALALKMALSSSEALLVEYSRVTASVSEIFRAFFKEEARTSDEEKNEFYVDLDNEESALASLEDMQFKSPPSALAAILHIRDGEPFSHPSARSRSLFVKLLPEFLKLFTALPQKDRALNNLDKFFTNIPLREGVYEILVEYPPARELLAHIFAFAQNLTDVMVNQPDVIKILGAGIFSTQSRPLKKIPKSINIYDDKLDWLRKERNSESIRIGVAYLMSHNNPFALMGHLSNLADDFLDSNLEVIEKEMRRKNITVQPPSNGDGPKFAIIGMGKLGRRELNYGSDLDLVFVYTDGTKKSDGVEKQLYYAQICRKLLNAVGGISRYGLAYKVDARLRPEGEKGPIITTAGRARAYYAERGALWERMAFCGARPVAGDIKFGEEFLRSLDTFVYGGGLTENDAVAINKMQRKIRMEKIKNHKRIAIKYGAGGILDIEFMAQKLKLEHGEALPHIRGYDTLAILESIKKEGWPTAGPDVLIESYRLLRTVETHMRMETGRGAETLPDNTEQLKTLEQTLRPFMKMTRPVADTVVAAMERAKKLI